jgi:hypothetical protein
MISLLLRSRCSLPTSINRGGYWELAYPPEIMKPQKLTHRLSYFPIVACHKYQFIILYKVRKEDGVLPRPIHLLKPFLMRGKILYKGRYSRRNVKRIPARDLQRKDCGAQHVRIAAHDLVVPGQLIYISGVTIAGMPIRPASGFPS